jgi:hypothetical protein
MEVPIFSLPVFHGIPRNTEDLQIKVNEMYPYHNVKVYLKKSTPDRGQLYWVVRCPYHKCSTPCDFKINIAVQTGFEYPRITYAHDQHNHAILTPADIRIISGSTHATVTCSDIRVHEKLFKSRIEKAIISNLNVGEVAKFLVAELFGPHHDMNDKCKRMIRTWKHAVFSIISRRCSNVTMTTMLTKEDKFDEYLKIHFEYVHHLRVPNSQSTKCVFWSSVQQQQQFRRFNDVIIVDGSAGKNNLLWCILLAVIIDSENKTQIVGHLISDAECKIAYTCLLEHMMKGACESLEPPSDSADDSKVSPSDFAEGTVANSAVDSQVSPSKSVTDSKVSPYMSLTDLQVCPSKKQVGFLCKENMAHNEIKRFW